MLREEVFAALRLTVTEAVRPLGVPRSALSWVLNGRAVISPDIALSLEAWLGEQRRPCSLTDKYLEIAEAVFANPGITMDQVAEHLGVAPASLYRYLPGGRGGLDALGN